MGILVWEPMRAEVNVKELMIIFIEDLVIDDLESLGFSAAELQEGGAEASRWPEVERAHLDRIKNTLTVLPHREAGS